MNYVIDATNLFFLSYCADPTQNANGEHIGAITGVLKIIQKLLREKPVDNLYFIWDGKGGSKKRKEMNSLYKEGRSVPKPLRLNRRFEYDSPEQENESRRQQQAALVCVLNSLPVHQIILEGVEADDIISFLSQKFSKNNEKVFIISNDKDFFQLLNENISIYRPAKKSFLSKEDIVKEFNISPSNFVLARSIEGDNSDNLKGVPGVGLKGIANKYPELKEDKWVSIPEFISLTEEKQKEKSYKTYDSILNNKDIIEKNYQIMQLYAPLIDYNNMQILEDELEKKPKFDMTAFYSHLTMNGIYGQHFRELVVHFIKTETTRK